MNLSTSTPNPEFPLFPPEQNPERSPQCDETHIGHNGRNVARTDDSGRDQFGEAVTPDILVDSDGNEDAAADGLVRVDGVGAGDGREGSHLDAGAVKADYYDNLCGRSYVSLQK